MIEPAKLSLKALLEEQLPAALIEADQRFNALTNRSVETPAPHTVLTYRTENTPGYPLVEMWNRASDPAGDSYADSQQHALMLSVTVVGDREETLGIWVERYLWALRRIAKDTMLGAHAFPSGLVTGREQYSLLERRPGMDVPFVQGGFVELSFKTVE